MQNVYKVRYYTVKNGARSDQQSANVAAGSDAEASSILTKHVLDNDELATEVHAIGAELVVSDVLVPTGISASEAEFAQAQANEEGYSRGKADGLLELEAEKEAAYQKGLADGKAFVPPVVGTEPAVTAGQ